MADAQSPIYHEQAWPVVSMKKEKTVIALSRRPRVRPRPNFFVPGITGKPRCLSKNLQKFENKKKFAAPPVRTSRPQDFQQVLLDICRERKQADCEREIVRRLKQDLEQGLIREAGDIQERLEFHANVIASEPDTTEGDKQVEATVVSDDTAQSCRHIEEKKITEEIESPTSPDDQDILERCSPATTVSKTSEDSNVVDKSFHTKSTASTSESDSVVSDDSSIRSDDSYSEESPDGCYVIAPIPSTESAALKRKADCYLIERIASSDTEETIDVYEDDASCSSFHSLTDATVVTPIKRTSSRRSPKYYSTSVAYLSTFGSF